MDETVSAFAHVDILEEGIGDTWQESRTILNQAFSQIKKDLTPGGG